MKIRHQEICSQIEISKNFQYFANLEVTDFTVSCNLLLAVSLAVQRWPVGKAGRPVFYAALLV